jgi:hypothetical protein
MDEYGRAELSKKRGAAAAKITDPEAKRYVIGRQGNAEGKGKVSDNDYKDMDKEADDTLATEGKNYETKARSQKFVGSFKRGGRVRKTGYAKVHKGERVLTVKQAKKRYARKKV